MKKLILLICIAVVFNHNDPLLLIIIFLMKELMIEFSIEIQKFQLELLKFHHLKIYLQEFMLMIHGQSWIQLFSKTFRPM